MASSTKSTTPPDVEAVAQRFLNRFSQQAKRFLEAQGLRGVATKVYRWKSAEDPTWQQMVLKVGIAADPQTGLKVWDDLGEMLQKALDSVPEAKRVALRETISLSVVWGSQTDV